MLSFQESRSRLRAKLATQPPGETWTTDYTDGTDAETYLARTGRDGTYGPAFEDLSDPYALHLPGAVARSVAGILAASDGLDLTIAVEKRPRKTPIYGLGGSYTLAGLMDTRGVVLALLAEYVRRGDTIPPEFQYATARVSSSGTHMNGVAFALAAAINARG